LSPSEKDNELERFEKYLREKSSAAPQSTTGKREARIPLAPKPDFAKTLEYLKDSKTGQYASDPDWNKFQQFLRREAEAEANHNDSGQGDLSHLPRELEGWNWGACILNVIWGGVMKVPGMALLGWVFLMLLPFIGIIFPFYLLIKGNEIAWKNRRWVSADEFRAIQKKWTLIGFALAGVIILLVILFSVWILRMIGPLLKF